MGKVSFNPGAFERSETLTSGTSEILFWQQILAWIQAAWSQDSDVLFDGLRDSVHWKSICRGLRQTWEHETWVLVEFGPLERGEMFRGNPLSGLIFLQCNPSKQTPPKCTMTISEFSACFLRGSYVYSSYLLLHKSTIQKSNDLKLQFCRSGIWTGFSWVILLPLVLRTGVTDCCLAGGWSQSGGSGKASLTCLVFR